MDKINIFPKRLINNEQFKIDIQESQFNYMNDRFKFIIDIKFSVDSSKEILDDIDKLENYIKLMIRNKINFIADELRKNDK